MHTSNEFARFYGRNAAHIGVNLYRSRSDVESDIFTAAFLAAELSENADKHRIFKIYSFALSKSDDIDILGYLDKIFTAPHRVMQFTNILTVVNTAPCKAAIPKFIEILTTGAAGDFVEVPIDLKNVGDTKVYYDAPHNNLVVLTDEYTAATIFQLGAVLPRIFGLVCPDELCAAYATCDMAEIVKYFEPIIVAQEKEKRIKDFTAKLDILKNTVTKENKFEQDIIALKDRMAQREAELHDMAIKLLDLQLKASAKFWDVVRNAMTEFVDYLSKNAIANEIERLALYNNNNGIIVTLLTKLLYWDEDYYIRYRDSKLHNIITGRTDIQRALLNNIFIDKTIEVLFETNIIIDFQQQSVSYDGGRMENPYDKGLPHPHIRYANCWGDNAPYIRKAFGKQDYIVLWEQIKSTMSGVTIPDGGIFEAFIRDITENYITCPCLRIVSTGEIITPVTFMEKYPGGLPK
jgi:hypothetical protein